MASQSVLSQKKRGPAPTGKGMLIGVRLQPSDLTSLDKWIQEHDPTLSRPEALRRLMQAGLASPARLSVDQRISKAEQKIARKIPAKASPERGVALMRKGLAEVEHRTLTAKKATQLEPASKGKPAESGGKKDSNLQDGKRTRRALVAKTEKRSER